MASSSVYPAPVAVAAAPGFLLRDDTPGSQSRPTERLTLEILRSPNSAPVAGVAASTFLLRIPNFRRVPEPILSQSGHYPDLGSHSGNSQPRSRLTARRGFPSYCQSIVSIWTPIRKYLCYCFQTLIHHSRPPEPRLQLPLRRGIRLPRRDKDGSSDCEFLFADQSPKIGGSPGQAIDLQLNFTPG